MINDETQDQDLQEEQKAMPADAKALLGKVHTAVPPPPPGDEWVAEAVKAVEASITKLIDEFRAQPFILYPPTNFGRSFSARSLHEEFLQVIAGMRVPPPASARPCGDLSGWGTGDGVAAAGRSRVR